MEEKKNSRKSIWRVAMTKQELIDRLTIMETKLQKDLAVVEAITEVLQCQKCNTIDVLQATLSDLRNVIDETQSIRNSL